MRIVGLPRAFYHIARHPPLVLSSQAQGRLRWLSCWQTLREHRCSSHQASQALGLPRATLYRWHQRWRAHGPQGLEDRSRRPHRRRQPTWSPQLAQAVLALREHYPRWGKDKLVVLLRREGWPVSTSMVGRILKRLRERGVLRESPRTLISVRRRQQPRPYATRKPQDYLVQKPGDLVQVDTLDVRPLPGVVYKHFTARDTVCRWDVLEVHTRATATTATSFLDTLLERMPFPIKALQVDGGSEFQAAFEEACQERGIRLFVLPPRSPKLNGHVERAHRTHREEFYEVYDGDLGIVPLSQALQEWEWVYNHRRPHQALDRRTPAEYLRQCHPELAPCLICSGRVQALDKLG
jgi:putative transposase